MKSNKGRNRLLEVNIKENDARVFLLFIQTSDAIAKYMEAILNKAGMSIIKLMVLQLLESSGGTLRPSVIAQLTYREKTNITALIRRMQKEQLIKISANNKDRRSIDITITDKGKQAIIDTVPIAVQAMKHAMFSIPDASLPVFEQALKILRQNACNYIDPINEVYTLTYKLH